MFVIIKLLIFDNVGRFGSFSLNNVTITLYINYLSKAWKDFYRLNKYQIYNFAEVKIRLVIFLSIIFESLKRSFKGINNQNKIKSS